MKKTMRVTEEFQHPDDDWKTRRSRMMELARPVLLDIYEAALKNPDEYMESVFYYRDDETGEYLEDLAGNRRPLPYWLSKRYNGEPIDFENPYDAPWDRQAAQEG